jgi:hypothetical protein
MEVRTAVRGTGTSKPVIVIVGVIAAVGLGAMAANISTKHSGQAATQSHVVQGQLSSGSVSDYRTLRGGLQMDNAAPVAAYHQIDTRGVTQAPNSFLGPDAQERNAKLAPAYHQIDVLDVTQAPNSFLGPDAKERNARLAAAYGVPAPRGNITRESRR